MRKDYHYLKDISELDLAVHTPARLMLISLLFHANTLDFIQLMKMTDLTWGNLSTHLSKLEESSYVNIVKTFRGKKPQTLVSLSEAGRQAYQEWGRTIMLALPEPVIRSFLAANYAQAGEPHPIWEYSEQTAALFSQQRNIWFMPKYQRWQNELPPLGEFPPLA